MIIKVFSGWLVLGAVVMAGVAASLGLSWPLRLGETADQIVVAAILSGWLVGYAFVTRFVILDAVRLARLRDLDGLQRAANVVKPVAIPFFLANFVALVLLTGTAGAWFAGSGRVEAAPGGIAVALICIVFTQLVLLPTSAYGLACLTLMEADGTVGRAFVRTNLVLHLLFVVDVFSGILVVEVARYGLGRRARPSAVARHLVTGVVVLGSVLALVWLVLGVILIAGGPGGDDLAWATALLSLSSPAQFLLLVGIPVVPLITFRTAVRHYLRGDLDELRRAARLVKLSAIPMFVQNFVVCVLFVLAATLLPVAASRGLVILAFPVLGAFTGGAIVVVVIGTYLMLLTTSIYGLACLALLVRQRAAGRVYGVVNALLQLMFVVDILSVLIVAHRAGMTLRLRNREPDQDQAGATGSAAGTTPGPVRR